MVQPNDPAQPEGKKPRPEEFTKLIARLEDLLVRYLESGKRSRLSLTPEQIFFVVDAAVDHSSRQIVPKFEETESGYFMSGLFEELIQQPQSIFEKIEDEEGHPTWKPLSPEIWEDCLRQFRKTLFEQVGKVPRRR